MDRLIQLLLAAPRAPVARILLLLELAPMVAILPLVVLLPSREPFDRIMACPEPALDRARGRDQPPIA